MIFLIQALLIVWNGSKPRNLLSKVCSFQKEREDLYYDHPMSGDFSKHNLMSIVGLNAGRLFFSLIHLSSGALSILLRSIDRDIQMYRQRTSDIL